MQQLTVTALAERLAADELLCVLDVREAWEVEVSQLAGSLHIPMGEIPSQLQDIPRDRPIVCLCHHGVRSLQVAIFLERQGFDPVLNLAGGIDAWAREIDIHCPTY